MYTVVRFSIIVSRRTLRVNKSHARKAETFALLLTKSIIVHFLRYEEFSLSCIA